MLFPRFYLTLFITKTHGNLSKLRKTGWEIVETIIKICKNVVILRLTTSQMCGLFGISYMKSSLVIVSRL